MKIFKIRFKNSMFSTIFDFRQFFRLFNIFFFNLNHSQWKKITSFDIMFETLLFQKSVRLLYFIHVMIFVANIVNFSKTMRFSTSKMHNELKYIEKYSFEKIQINLNENRKKTLNNNAILLNFLDQYLESFWIFESKRWSLQNIKFFISCV